MVRATTAGTAATATERATTAAELLAAVCKPDESDHWTERCGLFDRARLHEMINKPADGSLLCELTVSETTLRRMMRRALLEAAADVWSQRQRMLSAPALRAAVT